MASGLKTGGRVKGTPNKATAARADAESASDPSTSFPLKNGDVPKPGLGESGPAFPAYKLARVDQLVPYANNARTHSDSQIAKIVASIREFGFTNPVLTDGKKGIVAGHGRVLAAQRLGMDVVPAIELSHLSAAQRRAYILADNRLALDAGWDDELLLGELTDLRDAGFDLALTGFDAGELDSLFGGTEGETDPDDVPEVQAEVVSRLGDVWTLGRHRLVCGDSTDATVVETALNGAKPHLMVTDPPYGVAYDADWRNEAYRAGPMRRTIGAKAIGKVANDEHSDWREAWALFPGHVAYVWHGGLHAGPVQASLDAAEFEVRAQIIWNKSILVISRGHYHWKHEACWYAVKRGATANWSGDRKQSTVWDIDKPRTSESGHSTQKPVECMRRPIENNSKIGDSVYEPFSGSGTTIIAAEMTGRACHAIEIEPRYIDVAVRRWQAFAGAQATLESTGQSFAAIEAGRSDVPLAAASR